MNRADYEKIEGYMLRCMDDSAHDRQHIYRVLFTALDLAQYEKDVDTDILIAACLLHDIGRKEQFEDPALCHAQVGAEKAKAFLLENGFGDAFAARVADCVRKHRFRSAAPPEKIEEKILFDADKLDVAGLMGIARSLLYEGKNGTPMYSVSDDLEVLDGTGNEPPSFFKEYNFKLKNIYGGFYTERARSLAKERKAAAQAFYDALLNETLSAYEGKKYLSNYITNT